MIGGNGLQRTLPLAAQYADEWNGVLIPATKFRELNAQLDGLLKEVGRQPAEVRRSLMTGIVFGRNQVELDRKVTARGSTVAELRRHGLVAGTPAEVVNQLEQFAQAGVQRIMLQWSTTGPSRRDQPPSGAARPPCCPGPSLSGQAPPDRGQTPPPSSGTGAPPPAAGRSLSAGWTWTRRI